MLSDPSKIVAETQPRPRKAPTATRGVGTSVVHCHVALSEARCRPCGRCASQARKHATAGLRTATKQMNAPQLLVVDAREAGEVVLYYFPVNADDGAPKHLIQQLARWSRFENVNFDHGAEEAGKLVNEEDIDAEEHLDDIRSYLERKMTDTAKFDPARASAPTNVITLVEV